jgi:hypothetical protein
VRARFPNAPDSMADDVLALLAKLAAEGFIGREVTL